MGGVRYRVRRLLKARWRSAAVLAIIVALVGAVVLTLVAGTIRTATAPDRFEDDLDNRWDTTMEQNGGFPLTEEIAALPAVEDVAAATFFFGGLTPGGPEEVIEGITFVGTHEALLTDVVEGHGLDPDEPDEFVATADWVETADAEVGDEFTLFTISAESANEGGFDAEPDGPQVDARLVGVIDGATGLEDEFPLAVFPMTLLDEGSIGLSGSQMLAALADGSDLEDLRAQLDGLEGGDQLGLRPIEPVPETFRDAVDTQVAALTVITLITALAGLLVVAQVAVRRARLADDQRLSLSALGFTRAQLLAEGVGRVGVPALVGVVVAGGLAYALSGLFPVGFVERLEPDPGPRVEPLVHLLGPVLLVGGLVGVVAILLLAGTREPRHRTTVTDRLADRLGEARVATGLRFAFARHSRDPGSMSTPVLGVVVLVAALTGAATYGASLDQLIDDPARWGLPYDLGTGQGGFERVPDEVVEALLADPDVAGVTLLGNIAVNVGERSTNVTGYEVVRGQFELRVLAGELPASTEDIALGEVSADEFGVEIGDDFTIEAPGGERTLRVSGLVVVPGVEGGDGVGQGGVVTADGFAALDPEAALTASAIDVREGASVDEVAARLGEATGLSLEEFSASGEITNYDRVRSAPYVVALLVGVLALASVANVVITTLQRRGRDIALLRAVGADRRWLSRVEHVHAVTVALVVGVLGALIGVVVGRWLFITRVTDRIGAADDTVVPLVGLVVGLVVLIVVADLVAQVTVRWRHASVARRLATE